MDSKLDANISFQEILDQDPSPRLIIDQNGQILFGNQATSQLIAGFHPQDSNQSIGQFASYFGGEEELSDLVGNISPGETATTFLSLPGQEGPRLIQWSVKKNSEAFYLYGLELNMADPVTGLFNRAYLEAEIKRMDTLRELPISILFVDADGLKSFNDQNDHSVGDTYLFLIAQTLVHSLRANDILGRWGGDEDLVILPKTDPATAQMLVDRINSTKDDLNAYLSGVVALEDLAPSVRELVLKAKDHPGFNLIKNISFTIGVHTKEFGSKGSLREVVDQADKDMLVRKKTTLTEEELMARLDSYTR